MSQTPPKSRTFKQMKEDIKRLQEENLRLKELQDQKEPPTPTSIAKKNPNRTNPNPNQPIIKLMDYSTDWIEQERSNVVVELNSDFEDAVIEPHSRIIEADNLSMIGLNQAKQDEIVLSYQAFSIVNLAYRLILTLPSGYRLEAKNLIDAMKADDVPQNTPVINEMLSHVGKTKTENYGNLRVLYPLQLAKKKICKAMCLLRGVDYYNKNLFLSNNHNLHELNQVWRTGIFKDKDAPDFIAQQGLTFIDTHSKFSYKYKIDKTDYYWMIPDRFHSQFLKQGRYRPTVELVSMWCRSCRILLTGGTGEEQLYWHLCCAMIAQIIDLRYITSDLTLNEWEPEFKDSKLMDLKWEDFSTYMGIADLDTYVSKEQLTKNYDIIIDQYRLITEKHVKSVFKLNPIKKDEFGTEAQMLICNNWNKDGNNSVDTSFKITDKNKAVAAGLFNFTNKVEITVSDRMHLKNSFRSMISNLVNSFSRK